MYLLIGGAAGISGLFLLVVVIALAAGNPWALIGVALALLWMRSLYLKAKRAYARQQAIVAAEDAEPEASSLD